MSFSIKMLCLHPFQGIQSKYTMGPELNENTFHVATVRSPLTKNLAIRFADVQDEIACAFKHFIPPTDGQRFPASRDPITFFDSDDFLV